MQPPCDRHVPAQVCAGWTAAPIRSSLLVRVGGSARLELRAVRRRADAARPVYEPQSGEQIPRAKLRPWVSLLGDPPAQVVISCDAASGESGSRVAG